MESEDLEEVKVRLEEQLSSNWKKYGAVAGISLLFLVAVYGFSRLDFREEKQKKVDEKSDLTKYQRRFVECPEKYLKLCTKMSKIPTEKVSFKKAEEGKLYLELSNGRTLVAKIQEEGRDGYLIRIQ